MRVRQDEHEREHGREQRERRRRLPALVWRRGGRTTAQVALGVGAIAFGIHTLLPQVGGLPQTVEALRHANWFWVLVATVASVGTYLTAAVSLMAVSRCPLRLGRTTVVQLAASFTTTLAPSGLGRVGLNERYLEKSGVRRPDALAALSLHAAAAALVHGVLLLVAVPMAGVSVGIPDIPRGWPWLLAAVVVPVALTVVLRLPYVRRKLVRPSVKALRGLVELFHEPARATALLVSTTALSVVYVLCLVASLVAVGGDAAFIKVAAAYLVASALGSASPTPGGLGVIEASLVAALTAAGIAAPTAVAAVLLYRLVTYWLPIAAGAVALRWLARRDAV